MQHIQLHLLAKPATLTSRAEHESGENKPLFLNLGLSTSAEQFLFQTLLCGAPLPSEVGWL